MKFTLSWLKEHLETEARLDEVVEKLTAIGLEVEGVENPAEKLAPFTIARVLTAERHPQADKLQVLSVDAGTGEPIQVVCGAPNARAGMLGVFGAPGAYVPGSDITLKGAAIRGVESRGMMCSVRELSSATSMTASSRCPTTRRSARATPAGGPRRSGDRHLGHSNRQDRDGRPRHRPRPCRRRPRDAEGRSRRRRIAEALSPARRNAATEDPEGCPLSTAASCAGVRNRASPASACSAPEGGRPAPTACSST
jgi:phenylalanyl-tRNA synthetase beta chain